MSISIETARKVLEASKRRARDLRSPVSIAIVDAAGNLVLFERMMAPYGWVTGNISVAKASTAVMFNQSTDAVAQWGSGIPGFASSMATMTSGKFIMAAGGWPIRAGGATIGGIGVSGGNAPGRDDEIARAGLAAAEHSAQDVSVQPQIPQPVARPTQQFPPSSSQYLNPDEVPASPVYNLPASQQAPQPINGEAQPSQPQPGTFVAPDQHEAYEASFKEEYLSQSNPDRPGGQS